MKNILFCIIATFITVIMFTKIPLAKECTYQSMTGFEVAYKDYFQNIDRFIVSINYGEIGGYTCILEKSLEECAISKSLEDAPEIIQNRKRLRYERIFLLYNNILSNEEKFRNLISKAIKKSYKNCISNPEIIFVKDVNHNLYKDESAMGIYIEYPAIYEMLENFEPFINVYLYRHNRQDISNLYLYKTKQLYLSPLKNDEEKIINSLSHSFLRKQAP
jgi:hypothetical protein